MEEHADHARVDNPRDDFRIRSVERGWHQVQPVPYNNNCDIEDCAMHLSIVLLFGARSAAHPSKIWSRWRRGLGPCWCDHSYTPRTPDTTDSE